MINPYAEWLGLPPETTHPDLFELLQLDPEQANPAAVAAAVNASIIRVRGHRPGPHAKQWAALIDELKQAKQTLNSPRAIERYRQQKGGGTVKAWRGTPKTPKPDPQVKKSKPKKPSQRDEFDPMAPVAVPLEDFLKAATPPTKPAHLPTSTPQPSSSQSTPAPPAQATRHVEAAGSAPAAPSPQIVIPNVPEHAEIDAPEPTSKTSPQEAAPVIDVTGNSTPESNAMTRSNTITRSNAMTRSNTIHVPASTPAGSGSKRVVSDQLVVVSTDDPSLRRAGGLPWAVIACVAVLILLSGLLIVQVSGLFNDTSTEQKVSQTGDNEPGLRSSIVRKPSKGAAAAQNEQVTDDRQPATVTEDKRPWAKTPTEENDTKGEPVTAAPMPENPSPLANETSSTEPSSPTVAPDDLDGKTNAESPSAEATDPLVPRQDIIRFGDHLMAARQSMYERDMSAAREQLNEIESWESRPGDQAMRLRLVTMMGLVEQFWEAVERGAGTLQSAQELVLDEQSGTMISITEVKPGPVIVYRFQGRHEETVPELPTELAVLVAKEVMDEDDPSALRMLGAFYAIESLAKSHLKDKAIELWSQAEQLGADTSDLMLYFEDDYNLVNSLVEQLPIPADDRVRAAEVAVRADWADRRQGVNSTEERAALARSLARAAPRDDEPVNRYVLFQDALDWAGRSGQPNVANEIVDQLSQWFVLERPLLLRAQVMMEVAKNDGGTDAARETSLQAVDLANQIVEDEALLAEAKDQVEQLFQAALAASRRTRDRDFQIEVRKSINDVRDKFQPGGLLR